MTDDTQDTETHDTGDAGATASGAPASNLPVLGIDAEEVAELLPQVYTMMLVSGAIMRVRLFNEAVQFAHDIAQGGVGKIMTLGGLADGRQVWVPLYVRSEAIVGWSPEIQADPAHTLEAEAVH